MLAARVVCLFLLQADALTINVAGRVITELLTLRRSNTAIRLLLDRHLRLAISTRKPSGFVVVVLVE